MFGSRGSFWGGTIVSPPIRRPVTFPPRNNVVRHPATCPVCLSPGGVFRRAAAGLVCPTCAEASR